jgi:hypothetical protein
MSRGSALLEVLVIGALIVLAVAQGAVVAGRLHAAGDRVTEAAQIAASWAARHGDTEGATEVAQAAAPDAHIVRAFRTGDEITVVVRTRVGLIGSGAPWRTVTGRATARVSAYRSNRG